MTTLYERLGGSDGISRIVDDAIEEHMNNPAVNARFLPLKEEPERLKVIKQHTIEFFSSGSGGPPEYNGQDMETAHKGMNISHDEYMHVIDDVLAALDKNDINDEAKKDVLYILWSLKGMILSK
ncbi:group I truncated hemoglobin [Eudoraea adriatica]|uniref:group I truncated hemoglobin n=1 Tax=Eudoraea adriatica TaxID=446681 RepID=UPI000382B776|nr:group 1 truncated hemoglobin [Eudoraea adriatica]